MSDLTEFEFCALNEEFDDKYRSLATFDQVIADFGDMPPFSNIHESEARHIETYCVLYARYGMPVGPTLSLER